jgi:plasmid stabilization system protein ParE
MAVRGLLFFTPNFAANLDSIQLFLAGEGQAAFRRLLTRLFDDVCPQLSRFPLSGRSFLVHSAGSREAKVLLERLRDVLRKGDDIREIAVDKYVLLYLIRGGRLYFLAVKHHRQLSFDLQAFWP